MKTFKQQFGIVWGTDRIVKRIQEDIAQKVAADVPDQNAKQNGPNTAKIELDADLM